MNLLLGKIREIWEKNVGKGKQVATPGDVTATVFMAISQLAREGHDFAQSGRKDR